MKKILYISFLFILVCSVSFSQIGLPSTLPNPSSNGYIKYGYVREDSGFITMPRDTFCAKYPTIIKHNNGKYYRTEGNCTRWFEIFWNTEDWSLNGNSGTVAGTNFIGTTDNIAWVIKTNNTERARFLGNGNFGIGTTTPTKGFELVGSDALINGVTTGRGSGNATSNTAFGNESLLSNTTGTGNTAIGRLSMFSNISGQLNVAIGLSALAANVSGSTNVAVGFSALNQNISGSQNTAIGNGALTSSTTSGGNTAVGYQCLPKVVTGVGNTAIGRAALNNNLASYNTAVGFSALDSNTTGTCNTAMGVITMASNRSGMCNTAVGDSALRNLKIGNYNTAIGKKAGDSDTSGEYNTYIGTFNGIGSVSGSNNTFIGARLTVSNPAISNTIDIADGAGVSGFRRDASNNVTIPIQQLQYDTTKKITVQDNAGRLYRSYWPASLSLTDVYNEVVVSAGSTTVTLAHPYVSGTIRLYILGARIDPNQITEATATTITLGFAPGVGDRLILDYKY